MKEYINYNEFLEKYKNHLVQVNDDDDVITGCYRLLETEKDRAWGYHLKGYKIFTIYENNDNPEEEIVRKGYFDDPFVIGYFVTTLT